jgi:hypothetical protein
MIALVLGGAKTLAADLDMARSLVVPSECVIVACNDAGIVWPGRLDHWVTAHPEELGARKEQRRERGHPDGYRTWTRPYPFGMKERERMCDHVLGGYEDGSSGLLALGVAIAVGAHAILCGIPMDTGEHFNRASGWGIAEKYREGWKAAEHKIRGRARSCSGWTADLLGMPTNEWVALHTGPVATGCTTGRGT